MIDQDLSRCLTSMKDSSQVLKLARVDSRSHASKIASSTQEESSSLDQGLEQVKKKNKTFKTCVMFVSNKILFLDKM